jgi:hypothetical protein
VSTLFWTFLGLDLACFFLFGEIFDFNLEGEPLLWEGWDKDWVF